MHSCWSAPDAWRRWRRPARWGGPIDVKERPTVPSAGQPTDTIAGGPRSAAGCPSATARGELSEDRDSSESYRLRVSQVGTEGRYSPWRAGGGGGDGGGGGGGWRAAGSMEHEVRAVFSPRPSAVRLWTVLRGLVPGRGSFSRGGMRLACQRTEAAFF